MNITFESIHYTENVLDVSKLNQQIILDEIISILGDTNNILSLNTFREKKIYIPLFYYSLLLYRDLEFFKHHISFYSQDHFDKQIQFYNYCLYYYVEISFKSSHTQPKYLSEINTSYEMFREMIDSEQFYLCFLQWISNNISRKGLFNIPITNQGILNIYSSTIAFISKRFFKNDFEDKPHILNFLNVTSGFEPSNLNYFFDKNTFLLSSNSNKIIFNDDINIDSIKETVYKSYLDFIENQTFLDSKEQKNALINIGLSILVTDNQFSKLLSKKEIEPLVRNLNADEIFTLYKNYIKRCTHFLLKIIQQRILHLIQNSKIITGNLHMIEMFLNFSFESNLEDNFIQYQDFLFNFVEFLESGCLINLTEQVSIGKMTLIQLFDINSTNISQNIDILFNQTTDELALYVDNNPCIDEKGLLSKSKITSRLEISSDSNLGDYILSYLKNQSRIKKANEITNNEFFILKELLKLVDFLTNFVCDNYDFEDSLFNPAITLLLKNHAFNSVRHISSLNDKNKKQTLDDIKKNHFNYNKRSHENKFLFSNLNNLDGNYFKINPAEISSYKCHLECEYINVIKVLGEKILDKSDFFKSNSNIVSINFENSFFTQNWNKILDIDDQNSISHYFKRSPKLFFLKLINLFDKYKEFGFNYLLLSTDSKNMEFFPSNLLLRSVQILNSYTKIEQQSAISSIISLKDLKFDDHTTLRLDFKPDFVDLKKPLWSIFLRPDSNYSLFYYWTKNINSPKIMMDHFFQHIIQRINSKVLSIDEESKKKILINHTLQHEIIESNKVLALTDWSKLLSTTNTISLKRQDFVINYSSRTFFYQIIHRLFDYISLNKDKLWSLILPRMMMPEFNLNSSLESGEVILSKKSKISSKIADKKRHSERMQNSELDDDISNNEEDDFDEKSMDIKQKWVSREHILHNQKEEYLSDPKKKLHTDEKLFIKFQESEFFEDYIKSFSDSIVFNRDQNQVVQDKMSMFYLKNVLIITRGNKYKIEISFKNNGKDSLLVFPILSFISFTEGNLDLTNQVNNIEIVLNEHLNSSEISFYNQFKPGLYDQHKVMMSKLLNLACRINNSFKSIFRLNYLLYKILENSIDFAQIFELIIDTEKDFDTQSSIQIHKKWNSNLYKLEFLEEKEGFKISIFGFHLFFLLDMPFSVKIEENSFIYQQIDNEKDHQNYQEVFNLIYS